MGREEKRIAVKLAQYIAHIASKHRFELKHVAHKKQLLAAERLPLVARIGAQQQIHEINYVGPHHRDLVDNYQFELAYEFHKASGILHSLLDAVWREVRIAGHYRLERNPEKRMESDPAHIHRRDSGRCEHHIFLTGMGSDIAQESRFSRSGLAGQENRLFGVLQQFPGFDEFGIVEIYVVIPIRDYASGRSRTLFCHSFCGLLKSCCE